LFLFPDRIEAARDPWGIRPLSIGRLPGANGEPGQYVVASETCAFDAIGADFVRDVQPGEIVRIDDHGLTSRIFAEPAVEQAKCVFEHVYFANPASNVFGHNVQRVREELGRQLARESHVDADCVVPMPDSGRTAALGYSKESGVTFMEAIVPNRFVGRTFILPDQAARDRAVNLKLNIIADLVRGKRIIVVDDSIVRGTTTRSKMRALRRAGAKEIHLRISCPPIRYPCFYGIDFATPQQLIAHERSIEEIRQFIEVDSLSYLSLEGTLAASKISVSEACTACWTGNYKVPIDHPVTTFTDEPEQLKMF
jgi:amidophosphoribosyltransferase